jgi:outer membrane protein insertion porin family/translocation and assembly module TamA
VWTTQVGTARFTFNQLQVTPGLGLRYFSPVGAIQLNVGYNPYTNRAGPAYFAAAPTATSVHAPLICVTAPGVTPVPISSRGGELVQDISACPSSFVPFQSNSFFSHLTLTLSIGTDF